MESTDESKEDAVKRKREAREHVNAMYSIAMIACHDDPDVMEKADELALAIYKYHDVLFVDCARCEEDEIVELAVPSGDKYLCQSCGIGR